MRAISFGPHTEDLLILYEDLGALRDEALGSVNKLRSDVSADVGGIVARNAVDHDRMVARIDALERERDQLRRIVTTMLSIITTEMSSPHMSTNLHNLHRQYTTFIEDEKRAAQE